MPQFISERDSVGMDLVVAVRQASTAPRSVSAGEQICIKYSSHFIISFIARSSKYSKVSQKSGVLNKEERLKERNRKRINMISDVNLTEETKRMEISDRTSQPVLWQWGPEPACAVLEGST